MPVQFPTEKVTNLDGHDPQLHSVVRGRNDYGIPAPATLGTPQHDEQVELFLSARHDVTAGIWPATYFEALGIEPAAPAMFASVGVTEDDPKSAARLVDHAMDHPYDLHRVFVAEFGNPVLKQCQTERTPQSASVDFLGFRLFDAIIANNIYDALVEAFQVKYFFATARPEHVFASGALVAEYKCPPHPSYVAGHGAIAGATVQTWIDNAVLEDEQVTAMIHAGRQYAHYRTLAGVHWAEDNTAGFDLGRQVAAL